MKQKSYMVAVQVTIRPTVYVEVLANSAAEAVGQVESDVMQTVKANMDAFIDEAVTDYNDLTEREVRVISCGRANQYHSAHECELCSEVLKNEKQREY